MYFFSAQRLLLSTYNSLIQKSDASPLDLGIVRTGPYLYNSYRTPNCKSAHTEILHNTLRHCCIYLEIPQKQKWDTEPSNRVSVSMSHSTYNFENCEQRWDWVSKPRIVGRAHVVGGYANWNSDESSLFIRPICE